MFNGLKNGKCICNRKMVGIDAKCNDTIGEIKSIIKMLLKGNFDYMWNTMKNSDIRIGLVIMASGLGKRFGGNKLLETLDGKPIIQWIIDTTDGLFDKRVVVTRNNDIKNLCDSIGVECILHEYPNRNDTVRIGLSWQMDEVDYCFFTPSDQPLISKASITNLVAASKKNKEKIIRACYQDLIGTPTGFPKKYFNELLNLPEHKGGNLIAAKYDDEVYKVEVHNEYELMDIDTVSDLEKMRKILENINL